MYFKGALPEQGRIISCLVLNNIYIYCIITFYCLLPSYLQILIQIYFFYLLFIFSFYFISGEEPYHGCTDIKPLLLLLLIIILGHNFSGYMVVVNRKQGKVIFELILATKGGRE